MSLGPTTTQDTSKQTSPWGPQSAALQSAFDQAQKAYGTTQSGAPPLPTNFTAGANANQQNTYQQAIDFANGNVGTGQGQIGAGQTALGIGQTGMNGAITGLNSFDPTSTNNPQSLIDSATKYADGQDIPSQVKLAMQGATEQARDVTMPGIEQNAAITGNTNSSRAGIADGLVQRGLAEQAGSLGGALRSQAFQNGLTLAQQQDQNNNVDKLTGLGQEGSLGVNSFNSGNTGVNNGVTNETGVLNIGNGGGTGQQAATQADLTNQLQQFQNGQTAPFTSLQSLMSIIGSQNWGSNSTGTSTTNTDPGALAILGGLLGSASGVKKLF